MNIRNVDADRMLGAFGLETRKPTTEQVLPALGIFGVGVVLGAGVGLMLAPKPGRVFREGLTRRFGTPEETDYDSWTTAELYARAREMGIEGRSEMNRDDLIEALQAH